MIKSGSRRAICASAVGSCFLAIAEKFQISGSKVPILKPSQLPVTAASYPPSGMVVFEESTSTSSKMARSRTDFVKGPATSANELIGTIPAVEMIPGVDLMVYNACLPAGTIRDPSVSVPRATGEYPAETPTALPVDEPAAF